MSDSTGRVVASTERTFKGSICISGYGNNISGCFPIAYEAGGFSKRCKGAVFVVGNAESGQQMAKVIALTLAEKLKDYL